MKSAESVKSAALEKNFFSDLVETHLAIYSDEMTAHERAEIRQFAAKHIEGGSLRLPLCDVPGPEHLRAPLRQAIIEATYRRTVSGQRFTVKSGQSWL